MMCWCTVSDFSSFILLFCTLATVYFCFFLFCLFVCFVYGRGRGLHAAIVGVAPLFQVWGAKIQMFFSDWEGCGVTNDINERLMQTHINLVFLSLSQIPIFLKVIWSFDNDETILNKFGVFLVKILGVGKNELQLWKSSVFAK